MKPQMRDLREYLRAYRAYVSASTGWGKALVVALMWLSAIFAPYGMWRYQRTQATKLDFRQSDR